jgi:GntR family transcriptional regulator
MERAFKRHTVPIYTQLANRLREQIDVGKWAVGARLPSIEMLAKEFGVAAATVRQAIEVLEEEGLVRRRHGRGTFVKREARERRWLPLASDWDSLIRMIDPLKPKLILVETAERQPRILEHEGRPMMAYQHIKRVHYRDDMPFCLIDIYLAASIYLKNPARFREEVVVPILARMTEIKIGKASQSLTIDGANPEVAGHLGLPLGAPVAKVRRAIADLEGWCIYAADVVYRGEVIKLDIDLSPGPGTELTQSVF